MGYSMFSYFSIYKLYSKTTALTTFFFFFSSLLFELEDDDDEDELLFCLFLFDFIY